MSEHLRAVAATSLPGGSAWAPPDRPLADEAWSSLLADVREQRLEGALVAAAGAALPATVAQREDAHHAAVAAAGLAIRLERRAADAVVALHDAGLESRVLKGTAVAHLDYPSPIARHHGDVDLLVRTADFGAAVRALRAHGWARPQRPSAPGWHRRFGKALVLRDASGLEIDLHRTLADGAPGVWIDERDLWARGVPVALDGRSALALPREQRFLHACLHAAMGAFPARLGALRDVAWMGLDPELDLTMVDDLAQRWRAALPLAAAIDEAWLALRPLALAPVVAWPTRPSRAERVALAAERHPDRGHRRRAVSTFAALRGPVAKLEFVRMTTGVARPVRAAGQVRQATTAWIDARREPPRRAGTGPR